MLFEDDNEAPRKCLSNTLHTVRGEIPFSRLQGIDRKVFDAPLNAAGAELIEQARWNAQTFETRFLVEEISLSGVQSAEIDEVLKITGKETG